MSTTTTAPVETVRTVIERAGLAGAADLTGDALDAAVTAIRTRWTEADRGETEARTLFEAADIAWQNARVVKVRVAYAAAMLTPNKGEANLLNAARILLTDPEAPAATRTKQAKSRKNTLRNYVDAGTALNEAGLANSVEEPSDEERKIVAAVFREGNKRDKAEAKAGTVESVVEGAGVEPSTPADKQDPVTQADVVDAVEALMATVKRFTRDHGFAAIVADNLNEALVEVQTLIDSHKVDGGDA
jgi:hypothetical protein